MDSQSVAYKKQGAVPRFRIAKSNADILQFERLLQSYPLPAEQVTPTVSLVKRAHPAIGFTVREGVNLDRLNCYVGGQEKPKVEVLGRRVELRLSQPLGEGIVQVKCTLPVKDSDNFDIDRWRVWGMSLGHI